MQHGDRLSRATRWARNHFRLDHVVGENLSGKDSWIVP